MHMAPDNSPGLSGAPHGEPDGAQEWRHLRGNVRHQTVEVLRLISILLQDAIILVVGFAVEFAFEQWIHTEQPFFRLAVNISSAMFLLLYGVMVTVHVVHYVQEQFGATAATVFGQYLPWALAAGGIIAAVIAMNRPGAQQESVASTGASLRFIVPPPENTNYVSNTSSPWPALSPDGRNLAFIATGRPSNAPGGTVTAGVTGIWIHSFDSLADRILPGTEGEGSLPSPFWSPDGRFVGFFADGKLKKSDIAGGPPLVLCDAPVSLAAVGGTWNQDGVILFSAAGGIFQVSASGGEPKPVTKVNEARGEASHSVPYFLPDGRQFLFVVRSSKPEVAGVYVGQLDSLGAPGAPSADDEPERLVATNNKAEYAAGHLLFLRGRTLLAQPFDAASLKLSGEPVPVADAVGIGATSSRAAYSVAANGTLVFGPGGGRQSTHLRWFERGGKPLEELGQPGAYVDPELSPDGRRVAVERPDP